jgi:YidC/Oxa1 family membrane protein insertase
MNVLKVNESKSALRQRSFRVLAMMLSLAIVAGCLAGSRYVLSKRAASEQDVATNSKRQIVRGSQEDISRAVTIALKDPGFGICGIVARPLSNLLSWIHGHVVANWGWAIVLLTFAINLALLPTRLMAMRSAKAMQRIQPEINAIKLRYKDCQLSDPRRQEMQREMMTLQKSEGISMFGGCLPSLISWPLLYSFYRMLSSLTQLHQAHWLWITNLATADPYHVLPGVVLVSMVAMQWMTPSPGMDRQQQRAIAFVMPIVFGFLSWKCVASVALYWACSNFFGTAVQLAMNRASCTGGIHV